MHGWLCEQRRTVEMEVESLTEGRGKTRTGRQKIEHFRSGASCLVHTLFTLHKKPLRYMVALLLYKA